MPLDKDIAAEMGITLGTLKVYNARLSVKLRVAGKAAVLLWAQRNRALLASVNPGVAMLEKHLCESRMDGDVVGAWGPV
jgi:hypothetical protein